MSTETKEIMEPEAEKALVYCANRAIYDDTTNPPTKTTYAVFTDYLEASNFVTQQARRFAADKILNGNDFVSIRKEFNASGHAVMVVTVSGEEHRFYLSEVPLNPQD